MSTADALHVKMRLYQREEADDEPGVIDGMRRG